MNRPESPLLHAARISTTHPRMRLVDVLAVFVVIALGVMLGLALAS